MTSHYEKLIRDRYTFVLLKSPYEQMSNPEVRKIMPWLIKLKTEGYQFEYPHGILPFDSSDFIASHLLLCDKSGKELEPVLGFKSVTLENCDHHRIMFPMVNMLKSTTDTSTHINTIQLMLESYRNLNNSHSLAYNGSFTILPRLREDKELLKHLWDITFSLLTNYYIEYAINHVVAISSVRFKVHEKKLSRGWNYIYGPNGPLNSYPCFNLHEEEFAPMEITDISLKGLNCSSKFKDMWENRITFQSSNEPILKPLRVSKIV